jgi:hypothetical protein
VNGRLMERGALNPTHRGEMLALLRSHFEGVTIEQFERDLEEKSWVVLIEDLEGRIRGFSTLVLWRETFGKRSLSIIFSGDTIMDRAAWGTTTLLRAWFDAVRRLTPRDAGGKVYWLLSCSGYRTYRFLPVFWREFWPRYDAATPTRTQALMNHLAVERFGRFYDRSRGLVCFPHAARLRDDLCRVPAGRLRDPHVAFFVTRNPGWRRGNELVCLCDVSRANLNRAGRRVIEAKSGTNDAARRDMA